MIRIINDIFHTTFFFSLHAIRNPRRKLEFSVFIQYCRYHCMFCHFLLTWPTCWSKNPFLKQIKSSQYGQVGLLSSHYKTGVKKPIRHITFFRFFFFFIYFWQKELSFVTMGYCVKTFHCQYVVYVYNGNEVEDRGKRQVGGNLNRRSKYLIKMCFSLPFDADCIIKWKGTSVGSKSNWSQEL